MKHRGFTLIELLIVVAIIGILAAIAVPNFMNAQVRAKVARALADLHAVRSAVEMYRLDNGDYMMGPVLLSSYMGNRVWRQLTTPVAYLSGFLYDPFKPIENPTNASAGKRFYPLGLYVYRNSRNDLLYSTQPDTRPGALWLARSPGPDRWYHSWASRLYRDLAYDSSNGVTSAGDIIVSNFGILGQSDPGRDGQI